MRFALHIDPPLAQIPALLKEAGVDAFQTTLRNPQRFGKDGVPDAADQAVFKSTLGDLWGIVHGTLLINLASTDPKIRNASSSALLGDVKLAAQLGLAGVCFHVGYAKGHTSVDAALKEVVRKLTQVLDAMPEGACAVIENSCEGTELGKEIWEIGRIVRDIGAPKERLAVLIDTCHLHAAGFDLGVDDAGDRLADELEKEQLLDRLVAFHFNDCQGEVGCKRDRHAAPGEGSIQEGLHSVANHPAFATLPLILEIDPESARRGMTYMMGSR